MAFCTKCGKHLEEGKVCDCNQGDLADRIKKSIHRDKENSAFFENEQQIVPDSIKPDEGEVPIKQYKLAKLRSRIRGQRAEGRLQITNKRLIFRATGVSMLGKTIAQNEFAVSDIAGVELRKGNRISILNVIFGIILSLILSVEMRSEFKTLYTNANGVAIFLAIILFIVCVALFLFIRKRSWIKLSFLAAGMGAFTGCTGLSFSTWDIVFGFKLFTFTNILVFVFAIGWFFALLQVCFVPDLTFAVKTNSASEAILIRRKVWGTFYKQPQEYTGFSEVLPWKDTELVSSELGAIINDLQTMGDMAIDKWKE